MRIVFTGAHSTGKTTLLEEMRSFLHEPYYFSTNITRKLLDSGVPINEEGEDRSQRMIMNTHFDNMSKGHFVADRCLIDCFCYTWWLFDNGKVSEEVYREQLEVLTKNIYLQYDIIFYLKPEFDIHDDGVRSTDIEFQRDVSERFEYVINQFQIPVVYLHGSVGDRIYQIKQVIKNFKSENK